MKQKRLVQGRLLNVPESCVFHSQVEAFCEQLVLHFPSKGICAMDRCVKYVRITYKMCAAMRTNASIRYVKCAFTKTCSFLYIFDILTPSLTRSAASLTPSLTARRHSRFWTRPLSALRFWTMVWTSRNIADDECSNIASGTSHRIDYNASCCIASYAAVLLSDCI